MKVSRVRRPVKNSCQILPKNLEVGGKRKTTVEFFPPFRLLMALIAHAAIIRPSLLGERDYHAWLFRHFFFTPAARAI